MDIFYFIIPAIVAVTVFKIVRPHLGFGNFAVFFASMLTMVALYFLFHSGLFGTIPFGTTFNITSMSEQPTVNNTLELKKDVLPDRPSNGTNFSMVQTYMENYKTYWRGR